MNAKEYRGGLLLLAVILSQVPALRSSAQRVSQDAGASQGTDTTPETGAASDAAAPNDAASTVPSPAQATNDGNVVQSALAAARKTTAYSVSNTVAIDLRHDWHKFDPSEMPPPPGLAAYGPPFHLQGLLAFANSTEASILQVATSDNPLVGHDPYWLDTQLHTATSGMSMSDFLFYLFLPPSRSCMDTVSHNLVQASRVSEQDGSSSPDMQVFYQCPWASTLSDFYAARVSPGITFRQGATDGPHASGVFGNFYFSPMEQADFSGMTFFIFEAQETAQQTPDMTDYSNLPDGLRGVNADFFWAIGAASPFPFVADLSRKDNHLIHVAYAASGVGPDKRAEFIEILHKLRIVDAPETAVAVPPPATPPPAAESGPIPVAAEPVAPADVPANQGSNEGER